MRKRKHNPVGILKSKLYSDDIILVQAKKNKSIVYGGRAIQANIGRLKSRPTQDWDIFSSNPTKSANQIKNKLNRVAKSNYYYTTSSQYHPSTKKVYSSGQDGIPKTSDDRGVADFSPTPRNARYNTINGVRYIQLRETAKDKLSALKDDAYKFRHKKDKDDLDRIRIYEKMKKDKLLRNFLIK